MPDLVGFRIGFAPEVVDHLGAIPQKHHRLIERAIDEQLTSAPEQRTRNRNPLEVPGPFGSTWELRCSPHNCFRIFYEVDDDGRTVWVLAIGVKERERLLIAGEEFEP